jgi:hypothetical protein
MKNKIIVNLWLEKGCKQEDMEYNIGWKPINFDIYSDLFQEIVEESVHQWVSENPIKEEIHYELIMEHIIENDGAGTVTAEYFNVINKEINI